MFGLDTLSAQALDKMIRQATNTSRITVSRGDSVEVFTLAGQHKQKEPKDDSFYTWYTANTLKHTRGGYAGKLVHGEYALSNHNKDLLAKGRFQYGLKVGQWKNWYVSGQMQAIEQWKKGKRHGHYLLYDTEGNIKEKGNYRHDQLHGRRLFFERGQLTLKEKYHKGRLLENKKEKTNKRAREQNQETLSAEEQTRKSGGNTGTQEKSQKAFWQKLRSWKNKKSSDQTLSGGSELTKAEKKRNKPKKAESEHKTPDAKPAKKKKQPKESAPKL